MFRRVKISQFCNFPYRYKLQMIIVNSFVDINTQFYLQLRNISTAMYIISDANGVVTGYFNRSEICAWSHVYSERPFCAISVSFCAISVSFCAISVTKSRQHAISLRRAECQSAHRADIDDLLTRNQKSVYSPHKQTSLMFYSIMMTCKH